MHYTSDTLYFKEYNLVKHWLPLKLELTGFLDACPPKITMYAYISKVMSTGLILNMDISTHAMC